VTGDHPGDPIKRRAATGISPEMRELSEFIAQAPGQALPESVIEVAKHHVLDTFAAMVSGSQLHPGQLGVRFARAAGGPTEAVVAGTDVVTTAAMAAFANGMSAHSDETDDSHFTSRTHPGSAIVPAALATAQALRRDGAAFLRSVVVGYDVGCRLVHALDMRGFSKQNRSCHSFGGTFGAGVAAGSLYVPTASGVRYLLSYCAQSAAGCGAYMHDPAHVEKAFVYAGRPAQAGVQAAALVAAGFTAADDVFSGERNFLDAYAARPDRVALVDALGSRFEIVQTNIKKWCVGSPIQAALDGLEALVLQHRPDPGQIACIKVHLAPQQALTVDNRPMPNINLQHLLALMLVDGSVTFASSHDAARMTDPRVAALRGRIELVADSALADTQPPRQAIVQILLRDGRDVATRIRAVRGTAENRMSRQEVVAKARDLMAPVLGAARCEQLIGLMLELEFVPDMANLTPVLAVLPAPG
jgi:2-methylcitrate dehydratase PrpD